MPDPLGQQLEAQDVFPGDVIAWNDVPHSVHRSIVERDGRITLVIEAVGQRPRSITVPAEAKLVRIF